MRTWLVIVAALLPAGLAAQVPPQPVVKQAPVAVTGITQQQAIATALTRARAQVSRGVFSGWPATLAPALTVASNPPAVAVWDDVVVVGVTAPGMSGHIRVVLNRSTGAVLGSQATTWVWGGAPEWWRRGKEPPEPTSPS